MNYEHRCHQKHRAVAKVAAARKLAVRLFWMLRNQRPYPTPLPLSMVQKNPVTSVVCLADTRLASGITSKNYCGRGGYGVYVTRRDLEIGDSG